MIKNILIVISLIICLFLSMWVIQGNDFFMYKFFAPKYEDVRREVFENTKSYREGMVQELRNMQFQYVKATPEHKQALASIILHRVADFKDLPPDLELFINNLKKEKGIK
jgi:hypothetical protein